MATKIKINYHPSASPLTDEEKQVKPIKRFDVGDSVVVAQPFYYTETEFVSAATVLTVSETKTINGEFYIQVAELGNKFHPSHFFNKA